MKLEIYENGYVGYVSINPYEWEYTGNYPQTARNLENYSTPKKYESCRTDEGKIVESAVEMTDEEEILRSISASLEKGKIWGTKLVK